MSSTSGGRSTVTDDDLLDAVRDRTPASTTEVAYRLKRIEDRWPNPWVWSKKIGPTRVWFHAEHVYPCNVGIPWTADDSNPDGGIDGATKPRRRYWKLSQREVEQAVYRLAPAGTQEVADLLGTSRQSASYRLKVLVENESIWAKKVGPTLVWMHPAVMPDPDPDRDTSARYVMSLLERRRRRARGKCGKPLFVEFFSP